MRLKLKVGCLLVAAALAAHAEAFGTLSVEQVEQGIADKSLFVFDNNSPEQYAQGHVPTAKWIKFYDVNASDLPADRAARLVFYCANEQCLASHAGAKAAVKLGYTNVFVMPSGIMGWERAGKRIEK
jgi:rhodanese-related sulfurtransferase